jgi:hypothetical protein
LLKSGEASRFGEREPDRSNVGGVERGQGQTLIGRAADQRRFAVDRAAWALEQRAYVARPERLRRASEEEGGGEEERAVLHALDLLEGSAR